MSLLSLSQDLSPDKKVITESDTLLCWNLEKTRAILKKIVSGIYCDSISDEQGRKIKDQELTIALQKVAMDTCGAQNSNLLKQIELKNAQNKNLKTMMRRSRFLNFAGIGAAVLVTTFVILK